jgi:hypothetical protein
MFTKNLPVGGDLIHAYRHTDVKLIATFQDIFKSPKIKSYLLLIFQDLSFSENSKCVFIVTSLLYAQTIYGPTTH